MCRGTASTSKRFCNDRVPLDGPKGAYNNPEYVSPNQKLVGPANPKTKIPPVVSAPSHDMDYWRADNTVQHSRINAPSAEDPYRSGYISTLDEPPYPQTSHHKHSEEPYDSQRYTYPVSTQRLHSHDALQYEVPYEQRQHAKYAHTLQPGVYTANEYREPFHSNIGISHTQQFGERRVAMEPYTGDTEITREHPNESSSFFDSYHPQKDTDVSYSISGMGDSISSRDHEPVSKYPSEYITPYVHDRQPTVSESNVYDPRFTGYGTSYRAYNDDTVGQPRFYYKDIDAARMPNFITRNHVDHLDHAPKYGSIDPYVKEGMEMRESAHDAFLQGTLQHRTELQERYMRKADARAQQQREAPIRTNNLRMLGGMSGGC